MVERETEIDGEGHGDSHSTAYTTEKAQCGSCGARLDWTNPKFSRHLRDQ